MTDKEQIKQWFKTGETPTQEQFWEWMDSYFHKNDKIPIANIEGIQQLFELVNLLTQRNPLIIPAGQLQIYKVAPNEQNNILEVGDFVVGFVEGEFINATYYGGDPQLLTSYGIGETQIKEVVEIIQEK